MLLKTYTENEMKLSWTWSSLTFHFPSALWIPLGSKEIIMIVNESTKLHKDMGGTRLTTSKGLCSTAELLDSNCGIKLTCAAWKSTQCLSSTCSISNLHSNSQHMLSKTSIVLCHEWDQKVGFMVYKESWYPVNQCSVQHISGQVSTKKMIKSSTRHYQFEFFSARAEYGQ